MFWVSTGHCSVPQAPQMHQASGFAHWDPKEHRRKPFFPNANKWIHFWWTISSRIDGCTIKSICYNYSTNFETCKRFSEMLPGNFNIFWLNMASALDSSFKTPSLAAHRLPLSDGIHQGPAWAVALGQCVALAARRSWDGQHIAKQLEVSMAGEKQTTIMKLFQNDSWPFSQPALTIFLMRISP